MDFLIPVLKAPDKKQRDTRGEQTTSGRQVPLEVPPGDKAAPRPLARFRSDRTAMAAGVLLGLMVLVSTLAPLLSPHAPTGVDFGSARLAPSLTHPFGTDDLGRDVLFRILLGGRVTLAAGLVAAMVAVLIGMIAGAVAGYSGGWIDAVIMRMTDLALSVPTFFIVLLLASIFRPGFIVICLIIGVTQWMEVARVTRSVVLRVKQNEFVDAARALGIPGSRILFRHVLTHASGPVFVAATLAVAQAIMTESAVSFLGFGVQPPAASWGSLLQSAQTNLASAPWMALFPGAMIFLTMLCFYTIGDALRAVTCHGERR
jgi:peptide/nickel transport system permease protein